MLKDLKQCRKVWKKTGAILSLLGPSVQMPGTGHCQGQESGPGVALHLMPSSVRMTTPGKKNLKDSLISFSSLICLIILISW